MQDQIALTGEQSDHKIAGITQDQAAAEATVDRLREQLALSAAAVRLLKPEDDEVNRTLEPESRGIWKTLVRGHVWLAGVGAIIGLLVFLVMLLLEVRFVVDNPLAAGLALFAFCTVGGLLLGGALTLRPDHVPFLVAARAALRKGQAVVVVHAETMEQRRQARQILDQAGFKTVGTL